MVELLKITGELRTFLAVFLDEVDQLVKVADHDTALKDVAPDAPSHIAIILRFREALLRPDCRLDCAKWLHADSSMFQIAAEVGRLRLLALLLREYFLNVKVGIV